MNQGFELQGHRGARGQVVENTLPSFEAALDAGVDSLETDLHLTADNVVVLCHDPVLSPRIYLPCPGREPVTGQVPVRSLTLAQLRGYRAAGNPDPGRFPGQEATVTPLSELFAQDHDCDPLVVPTLEDLFRFVDAYAGELGVRANKPIPLRQRARQLRFDLELKRLPFYPETLRDGYDGTRPGLLEQQVVASARAAGVVERTVVRSFDHRCVRLIRELEPGLTGAVLVADTTPVDPAALVRAAGASLYCPSYHFVDTDVVRRLHDQGFRVLVWTVNEEEAWQRLLSMGVDGITTDYPQRLADWLAVGQAACLSRPTRN